MACASDTKICVTQCNGPKVASKPPKVVGLVPITELSDRKNNLSLVVVHRNQRCTGAAYQHAPVPQTMAPHNTPPHPPTFLPSAHAGVAFSPSSPSVSSFPFPYLIHHCPATPLPPLALLPDTPYSPALSFPTTPPSNPASRLPTTKQPPGSASTPKALSTSLALNLSHAPTPLHLHAPTAHAHHPPSVYTPPSPPPVPHHPPHAAHRSPA